MEKFWDKLSNYDLWGVILPGIMFNISIFTIYQWGYVGEISFDYLNNFGNTVAFIFISYFVGILLQELGSVIQKIIFFCKGEPAERFLADESKILSKREKEIFIELVKNEYNENFNADSKDECRIVFNHINTYLAMKGLSEKCDKMQALFGLSRGMFCSFAVNTIMILALMIFRTSNIYLYNLICCLCICLFASILLYRRTLRYSKIRVKHVCQIYHISSTKKGDDTP